MTISRRNFLQYTGALLAGGTLESCCLFPREPRAICPFDPAFTDENSILAIDVHSHIFNATDLQVRDFVSRIAIGQSGGIGALADFAGGLLQSFAWATAPDVAREFRKLDELTPLIMACEEDLNRSELIRLRAETYFASRAELNAAAERRMQEMAMDPGDLEGPMEALPAGSQGFGEIFTLPESYEQVFGLPSASGEPSPESVLEAVTVSSALKFIIEMFQYRFVSIYNYLQAYSNEQDIKIDLMTPAAVDFDWWLSKGAPTRSLLPDQMALMKKISILTGGRIHALVPFDPFRQVVHDLNEDSGFSPIALVQQSIEEYGAIGVKLYPPMGFAPFGNRQVATDHSGMWKDRPWLPEIARRDDFPARLDLALEKLYEYCASENVPVMGHSNESNGPTAAFEQLTSPQYWESAAGNFADVSFSFGHFGGAGSAHGGDESNVLGFLNLMAADQAAGGRRISADASYFSNVLDNTAGLESALESIFNFGDAGGNPAIDRLMYGADWKMLVAESGAGGYLAGFNEVITKLEDRMEIPGLREKFFGRNAAGFLGLARNRDNRARLEEFYDRNSMAKAPVWMDKVDKLESPLTFHRAETFVAGSPAWG